MFTLNAYYAPSPAPGTLYGRSPLSSKLYVTGIILQVRKMSWITCPRPQGSCIQRRTWSLEIWLQTQQPIHCSSPPYGFSPHAGFSDSPRRTQTPALCLTPNTTPPQRKTFLPQVSAHTLEPKWNHSIVCCGTASWLPETHPTVKEKQSKFRSFCIFWWV